MQTTTFNKCTCEPHTYLVTGCVMKIAVHGYQVSPGYAIVLNSPFLYSWIRHWSVSVCLCMCVFVCVYVYACMCVYACMYVCSVCVYVCVFYCMYMCMCVHMHMCVSAFVTSNNYLHMGK